MHSFFFLTFFDFARSAVPYQFQCYACLFLQELNSLKNFETLAWDDPAKSQIILSPAKLTFTLGEFCWEKSIISLTCSHIHTNESLYNTWGLSVMLNTRRGVTSFSRLTNSLAIMRSHLMVLTQPVYLISLVCYTGLE